MKITPRAVLFDLILDAGFWMLDLKEEMILILSRIK